MGQLNRAIIPARTGLCSKPAALAKSQQQVLHSARLKLVIELQTVGEQLIAIVVHKTHAAHRVDCAGLAVPYDRVGAQRSVAAADHDIARCGDRVAGLVIADDIGFKLDFARA